jgi:hypothetical protein
MSFIKRAFILLSLCQPKARACSLADLYDGKICADFILLEGSLKMVAVATISTG